jgi:hypothetical protein
LRAVLRALAKELAEHVPGLDAGDRMQVYEQRAALYLAALSRFEQAFGVLERVVLDYLREAGASEPLLEQVRAVLALDEAFCPRVGPSRTITRRFALDAATIEHHLMRMELPPEAALPNARPFRRGCASARASPPDPTASSASRRSR